MPVELGDDVPGRTIRELWDEYRASLPAEMPETMVAGLRRCFYSGAVAPLNELAKNTKGGARNAGAMMRAWSLEITEFGDALRAGIR